MKIINANNKNKENSLTMSIVRRSAASRVIDLTRSDAHG